MVTAGYSFDNNIFWIDHDKLTASLSITVEPRGRKEYIIFEEKDKILASVDMENPAMRSRVWVRGVRIQASGGYIYANRQDRDDARWAMIGGGIDIDRWESLAADKFGLAVYSTEKISLYKFPAVLSRN